MTDVNDERLLDVSSKSMTKTQARAWQRMLSGRRLDLLNPSPLDIEIEDVAHGLARVARWNGQTRGDHAFSVAQHCLLVERLAAAQKPGLSVRFRRAALLHDASEYVVGDLISPFKAALALDYKDFEKRLLEAIHIRFGLPARLPQEITRLIKKADRAAAYWEARRSRASRPRRPCAISGRSPRASRPISSRFPPRRPKRAFLRASQLWNEPLETRESGRAIIGHAAEPSRSSVPAVQSAT